MSHVDIIRQDRSPPDLQLPPGHVWAWVKELGVGGEGTAHLWAQLDESQKIVERIVIRNTDVRPSQRFRDSPQKGEWIELYIQQQLVPDGPNEAYTVPVLAASRIPGTTGLPLHLSMSFSAVIGHRLLHHQEAVKVYSEDNKAESQDAETNDEKSMERDTRYSEI
jgi:hypothetical protein